MTPNTIELLVTRIQEAYLDKPSLKLNLPQAQMRFSTDPATCAAVLDALVGARVLEQTKDGSYVRAVPRRRFSTHHAA
jgi:hypothetical protein